ncbi:MAG: YajQ family cyclic di-GMP-binding protein [Hymenobacteraceae bacterium]|nr:YajQ family cyclic di-GMP-binding protein [Hymenobacteraceae bacterium]MDX5395542.1 YajQ family cyclic di-GMP-binding protein [Hymenobacteraceae bacterium]MDX5444076.1 YajQ family cyclic di-GMP-binding protein [Hymenobacteraceae bacterium]MDX5511596.1 YajQ family cyclic di-GMP-binding protein [Hymenobacteraceae bacterium]
MASFDIVSKVDPQTMDNAINTAKKEIQNRYDFRDTKGSIDYDKKANIIHITTENDMRLGHIEDVIINKMVKQGLDATALDFTSEHYASGAMIKKDIKVKAGIDKETSKKIMKLIKDSKVKVSAAIMDEQVRVTGKKIDDLQAVIAVMRQNQAELGMPLQFVNMKS